MNDSKDHKAAAENPLDCRVMPGDLLIPRALWNSTERRPNHLLTPTKVIAVDFDQKCQSGIMLKVRTRSGDERWLDSDWFEVGHNAPKLTGRGTGPND